MLSWRDRWRTVRYKHYLPSIASAVAGALLGAGVQSLADSNLRVASAISIVLCLGLIAVYTNLATRDRENTAANQILREQTKQDASSVMSMIRQLEK